jgi:hypothetical protein
MWGGGWVRQGRQTTPEELSQYQGPKVTNRAGPSTIVELLQQLRRRQPQAGISWPNSCPTSDFQGAEFADQALTTTLLLADAAIDTF